MLSLIFSRIATPFRRTSLLTGLLLVPALSAGQVFVQENNNTVATNSASVSVAYAAPETAGNLNVVVVGWNDTSSSVTSVADDNTNNYVLVGTTAGHGLSQAIYYARNIVLPNNTTPTVTVTFNQTAGFPDVRILEYSGLSTTAPLDNWAGSSGLSTSADSGGATTTTSDLILGAGTTASAFAAAGAGFVSRVITSPFGDIVEDSNTAQPSGTYNATATVAVSNRWVMQVAGFSTTGVNFVNPPTISPTTPITPASGSDAGGTPVTITGTNFQPGAIVLFGTAPGGISGVNCVESGGTTITCLTPGDSDGAKDVTVVNVDGQSSSATAAYTFQNVTPVISTITPATGPTNGGTATTITGSNFQVGARVVIGALPAGNVVVQDSATITANTPGLPVGPADVTVNNPGGGTATTIGGFTYVLGTGPINYVQRGAAATASATTTIVGLMPSPQTAGNLNAVIIGWNDTVAAVSSVTDAEGNTYVPALPVVTGTALSQVIYYAKNIAGDGGTPNQITVTFNQAAQSPDVHILEYSGLDVSNPVDAVAAGFGSGLLADTGACTTTAAVEVVVAGVTTSSTVAGPGPGFNFLNLTANGDGAEHQITSVAGSCEATAPLNSTGSWVMQTATFKAPSAAAPDFSLSTAPASQTVIAGSPASYTISVTPVNGFNSAVTLTCAAVSLPTGASCAFAPSSVTPGAAAVTSALTITTSTATPVGATTVTVTGTSGSVSHNTSVGLIINPISAPPDFTIAATALSPASVTAGGSATSTITIAPLNGFNGAVALTCSIAPPATPAPTCALAPTSVANGSGPSTLTVATTAATTAFVAPRLKGVFYAMWLPIGLALVGSGFASRKKRILSLLLGCVLFLGLIFLAACGGGSSSGGGGGGGHPGTPSGTYTITVTGASGSLSHTATLSLVVQ
jgi:hypothetical protein